MAYDPLTADEVLPGEPCKSELFDKARLNFDDLNDRMTLLEGTTGGYDPLEFYFDGQPTSGNVKDGAAVWRIFRNITALACRLYVDQAGSAGTLEVEVERWNGSAWSSITSSPLSATSANGNKYTTSGTISISSLDQGQLLRVNINSVQTAMRNFAVYFEYEAR